MNNQFKTSITYFLQEGRDNLRDCLKIAFNAAVHHRIGAILIFTAEGLGLRLALDEFCTLPEFSHIRLVAVTFPVGKPFTSPDGKRVVVEISPTMHEELRQRSIPIVRAHLPFDPIAGTYKERGVLGQDLTLVSNMLGVFGGSMSLCIQATLMACDAGEIAPGEHVIALTSDTAILVQAAPTSDMLRGLAVREILCKPAIYTVGRGETANQLTMSLDAGDKNEILVVEPVTHKQLPAGDTDSASDRPLRRQRKK